MNFDLSIKQMLDNYPDKTPQIDKLREILQQTALLGLARNQFFEHALFYGGTALRILYGLDRYSEDLDFSLIKPDPKFNNRLNIWSSQFFHDIIGHLRCVDDSRI